MNRKVSTIDRTLVPNLFVLVPSGILFLSVVTISNNKSWFYSFFFLVVFGLTSYLFWIYRSRHHCILLLSDNLLKIKYFHSTQQDCSFDLREIRGIIKVERYHLGEMVGSIPKVSDFLNYRWYFRSEQYIISFEYGNESKEVSVITQPNFILFKSFFNHLLDNANLSAREVKHSQSIIGGQRNALSIIKGMVEGIK